MSTVYNPGGLTASGSCLHCGLARALHNADKTCRIQTAATAAAAEPEPDTSDPRAEERLDHLGRRRESATQVQPATPDPEVLRRAIQREAERAEEEAPVKPVTRDERNAAGAKRHIAWLRAGQPDDSPAPSEGVEALAWWPGRGWRRTYWLNRPDGRAWVVEERSWVEGSAWDSGARPTAWLPMPGDPAAQASALPAAQQTTALQRFRTTHATGHTGALYEDANGPWVRYEDACAALAQPAAQQPADELVVLQCRPTWTECPRCLNDMTKCPLYASPTAQPATPQPKGE